MPRPTTNALKPRAQRIPNSAAAQLLGEPSNPIKMPRNIKGLQRCLCSFNSSGSCLAFESNGKTNAKELPRYN